MVSHWIHQKMKALVIPTTGLNIKWLFCCRPDDNIGIAAGNIKMYENDNERFSEIYYKLFIKKILKLVDLSKFKYD